MKYKNVKSHSRICILMAVAGLLISLPGCKDDPTPLTPAQQVTNILVANGESWAPPSTGGVTIDGIDVTQDLFPGFSITFSESTFTTTGTSPVWLREDTWRFKDETATVIIRGQDNKEIKLTEVSADQLKLTLEWDETTTESGRSKSLKGKHEFILNK